MSPFGTALAVIFREALDSDQYESTWFKDNDPGGSFIPSLDQLTAAQASEPPVCGRNSVAAHAAHINFALQEVVDFLDTGNWSESVDWDSSWAKQTVTDDEWNALRDRLRAQAIRIHDHMQAMPAELDGPTIQGSIALVAHCAYHLGAIRQLAAAHLVHADR